MVKKRVYSAVLIALLASGCNQGIVDVEPPQISKLQSYFWTLEPKTLRYDELRMPDSVVVEWNAVITPQLDNIASVLFRSNRQEESAFSFTLESNGAVTIDNATSKSVFSLPDGFSLGIKSIDTTIVPYEVKKVIALDENTLIALTTGGKIVVSTNQGLAWVLAPFPDQEGIEITELNKGPGKSRFLAYVSTKTGVIYQSEDGLKWGKAASLNYPISTFVISKEGFIYASVSGQKLLIQSMVNSMQSKTYQMPGIVTGISFTSEQLDDTSTIILGIEGKGLCYITHSNPTSVQYGFNGQELKSDFAFGIFDDQIVFAGSLNSDNDFFFTLDGGKNWKRIMNLTGHSIRAIDSYFPFTYGLLPNLAIGGYDGSVFKVLSLPLRDSLLTASVRLLSRINSLTLFGDLMAAATDSGLVISTTGGTTWHKSTVGIEKVTVSVRRSEFTVFPKDTTDLRNTSESWLTANIVSNTAPSLKETITGTIVKHWTTLEMPYKNGKYDDVIEVRYAANLSPVITEELRVFYAKGVGPIIFQRFKDGNLRSQYYLRK